MQSFPSAKDWAWKLENAKWVPFWTELPEASKSCQQLFKCKCNLYKGCSGRCKCLKANLKCTALCKCAGECEQSND